MRCYTLRYTHSICEITNRHRNHILIIVTSISMEFADLGG